MSKFLGTPKVQYFDSSGNPLSGGKLYAYEVGTTTLKNTYPTIADANAETNANANPVILDSRGEATVVLKGSTKLYLTDSSDAEIWTVDNIDDTVSFIDTGSNSLLEFEAVSDAVNYLTLYNAVSGNSPAVKAEGTDSNIGFLWQPKGSGDVYIKNSSLLLDSSEGLKDDAGNAILLLGSTASAINYISVGNSATGTNPIIEAEGTDSNINIDFQNKGAAVYHLLSTSSAQSIIRLYENTNNGTNYIELQIPDSITSNITSTFPDLSGTLGLSTSASAMENETSEDKFIPPNLVKYNPLIAKAWAYVDSSGTLGVNYNCASSVRNSLGDYTVSWDTDFSSANYSVVATAVSYWCSTASVGTSSAKVYPRSGASSADSGFYVVAYGDQ